MPEVSTRRYEELDSLRGLAALVVVLFHFLLLFPDPKSSKAFNFFIRMFTSGHESVMLFFVLSGFVLSFPYIRGKQNTYAVFIKRRIARIYGPYLAALAVAVGGCALWHSDAGIWRSVSSIWSQPVTESLLAEHVAFLGNYPSNYNWAFWSLVQEMRISLVFPFLFLIVRRARLLGTVLIFGCFMLLGLPGSLIGKIPFNSYLSTFEYAGFFLMGILLAEHREVIAAWFQKHSTLWKLTFASGAFLLYEEGHLFLRTATKESTDADVLEAIGACGLIVLALNSVRVGNILKTKVPLFLGEISYSLYLIHCTVLFALVSMFHGQISNAAMFIAFLTLSLLLSWAFNVAIEKPFIRLSQKLGRVPVH